MNRHIQQLGNFTFGSDTHIFQMTWNHRADPFFTPDFGHNGFIGEISQVQAQLLGYIFLRLIEFHLACQLHPGDQISGRSNTTPAR